MAAWPRRASRCRVLAAWSMPKGIHDAAWIVMSLAYSYSGFTKLVSPSWRDGSALAYVLANPLARPTGLRDLVGSLPDLLLHMRHVIENGGGRGQADHERPRLLELVDHGHAGAGGAVAEVPGVDAHRAAAHALVDCRRGVEGHRRERGDRPQVGRAGEGRRHRAV